MAEFDKMSAEEFIAAFIVSNGGALALTKESIATDFSGKSIQVLEDETQDVYVFVLVDTADIEAVNDGSETLPDGDSSDSNLS